MTKIKKLLDRRKLSASEAARLAKVAPSTVTRMCNGQMPTARTVRALAGALGVPEKAILG